MFSGMDISASALTVQRLRMDVISSNIANAETTRGRYVDGKWQPYTRKMVVVEPNNASSFGTVLKNATGNSISGQLGVRATGIIEDKSPYKKVYQPGHPDADQEGFIYLPNVDILKETADLLTATRAYEANVTALNSTKSMLLKALEIGR